MKLQFAFALLSALCLVGAPASGQEKKEQKFKDEFKRSPLIQLKVLEGKDLENVEQFVSPFWIGVAVEQPGETLKSQLRLKGGVVVTQVMDDSPAKKAGLEQHDILLRFNDNAVNSVEDLLKAVGEAEENKSKVELLRRGEKTTVEVTAVKRPQREFRIEKFPGDSKIDSDLLERLIKEMPNLDGQRLLVIRPPGIAKPGEAVQKFGNLSIQIERKGDGPAKITVKRDGKEWKVDADSLDKLPADIRKMLPPLDQPRIQLRTPEDQAETHRRIIRRLEQVRDRPVQPDNQLDRVLEELEKLRKDVNELKKQQEGSN